MKSKLKRLTASTLALLMVGTGLPQGSVFDGLFEDSVIIANAEDQVIYDLIGEVPIVEGRQRACQETKTTVTWLTAILTLCMSLPREPLMWSSTTPVLLYRKSMFSGISMIHIIVIIDVIPPRGRSKQN